MQWKTVIAVTLLNIWLTARKWCYNNNTENSVNLNGNVNILLELITILTRHETPILCGREPRNRLHAERENKPLSKTE